MIMTVKCDNCGDTWHYKGEQLNEITRCFVCNKDYKPNFKIMKLFVFQAIKRVKG